jgi:hypothetical protein
MLRGELEGNHVPDVVSDKINPIDAKGREHARNITGLGSLIETSSWFRGEAQTAEVGNDHFVIPHQVGCHWHPHVAGLAISMQKRNRRPVAANPDMKRSAIRLQVLLTKFGWKRLHICRGMHGSLCQVWNRHQPLPIRAGGAI